MVVDVVIGSVVVVKPVIVPSQLSVAVGGVSPAVYSHCAVSCASEAKSATGTSISRKEAVTANLSVLSHPSTV